MNNLRAIFWAAALLCLAQTASAQTAPGQSLPADAANGIETRVHSIARTLRCPVCQGETLDESDAGVAQDLRQVLRDRLEAGDSDSQARAYLIARYGEAISLMPDTKGANLILWAAAPLLMSVAFGAVIWRKPRARPGADTNAPQDAQNISQPEEPLTPEAPLTPKERARLKGRLDRG